jgi:hypothetical protein
MLNLLTVQQIAALAQAKKPVFRVPWHPALMQYTSLYTEAVKGCTLADPCMLAAIVARESGGRNVLQDGMAPGPGCGVGICQVTAGVSWSLTDPSWPGIPGSLLDPKTNLHVATHFFLEPALERFPNNHVAAFAAYNLGSSGVSTELAEGLSPDAWTTGDNYGASVFTDWINFSAVSLGHDVEWTSYKP